MTKLHVSDHALVRFLERAGGYKIEPIRTELALSLERASDAARTIREKEYSIRADGLVYVIKNDIVTTVLYDD